MMPAPIPRVTVSAHQLPLVGDTVHISLLSDLHVDSQLCDYEGLRRMCQQRAKLENHFAVGLGDLCDLVMPPDLRRFRQSGQIPSIATRDDWFSAAVDHVGDQLENLGVRWLWVGRGNHEDEALKRHGWDATSLLAHRLGCAPVGYSGVHDFRLTRGTTVVTFRLAWHHGAWGGSYAKGYNSALPFFNSIDSWHVSAWGHNHASRVDPEVRLAPDPSAGILRERRVYLVACGSWTFGQAADGSVTHYTERHGYRPQPRQSPLIKVQLISTVHKGKRHYDPVYTIEV